MRELSVMPAELADARTLREIYSQYIETPITFEYELPSEYQFSHRMASIIGEYPYLICEISGETVGYAYAHRHMERATYQWNAELSIYISRDWVSRGVGRRLYSILLELLKAQGIKNAYAGVTLPNLKSERLHKSMGFRRTGIYLNTGYKCGAWHDVCWFAKQLAPFETWPEPVVRAEALSEELISEIISRGLA